MQLSALVLQITLIYYVNQLYQNLFVAGQDGLVNTGASYGLATSSIPTFWNFLLPSNAYAASYTVTHAPIQSKSSNKTIPTTWIFESFDMSSKLGKIITQTSSQVQETYIDGNSGFIYSVVPATGNCRRINVIAGLLDEKCGLLEVNDDFNVDKLYGLAALWIKLASFNNHFSLDEITQPGPNGYRMRAFNYTGQLWTNQSDKVNFSVRTIFRASSLNNGFTLNSIDFMPKYQDHSTKRTLYRTIVNVESFNQTSTLSWEVPKECLSLHARSANDKQWVDFPQVGYLIEAGRAQMFMKSELTISTSSSGKDTKMYAMDEWLHRGKLRFKTFGQVKSLDFIYFNDTKDVFDISKPYHCEKRLPELQKLSEPTRVGFKEFWSREANLVDDPSLLYYGPMSLWYLAERNREHAKLTSALNLAPLALDDRAANIKREMRTEKWTFTSPDESNPWSYDLYFEHMAEISDDRKTMHRWHVLNRIDLTANKRDDTKMKDTSQSTLIQIYIINYRYKLREREIFEKFELPAGYLCNKKHEHSNKQFDKLNLDLKLGYSIWYEASLEVVDDDEDSHALERDYPGWSDMMPLMNVSSTVIGKIVHIHEAHVDISAHYQKVFHINGSSSAKRFIQDHRGGLIYIEDQSNGSCEVSSLPAINHSEWVLQFYIGSQVETLILDEGMLKLLFTKSNDNYDASNQYHSGNLSIINYEKEIGQFPNEAQYNKYLNQGQATIVRQYQEYIGSHGPCCSEGHYTFHLHNDMSVKVLLLDEYRSKLRAVLSIAFRGANIGLADALQDINVAKCSELDRRSKINSLGRNFILEYQVKGGEAEEMSQSSESFQRLVFVNNLLATNLISPIQLDGLPTLQINAKGLSSVNFKLTEFPTAIKFATIQFTGSYMSDKLESRSEIRLVSSLAECSSWCDQVGCIALSYCGNQKCSLLTLNMLRDFQRNHTDDSLTLEEITSISSCTVAKNCNHFIWTSMRPRTLNKFVGYMDNLVNQQGNPAELKSFILTPNALTLVPRKFYEIRDDFGSLEGDLVDQAPIYKTIWYDQIVEPVKLDDLIKQDDSGIDYQFEIKQSRDYAECLETCTIMNCVAISHCKQRTTCLLITGRGDIKRLESALVFTPENLYCKVTVRDPIEGYTQFSDTLPPASFELKINDHSALMCASVCDFYNGSDDHQFKCLSFDNCIEISDELAPKLSSFCYLQRSHVMLDSFDKSILAREPNNVIPPKLTGVTNKEAKLIRQDSQNRTIPKVFCGHYSKTLLADYKQIPNKKLTLIESQVIRGSTADRCAIDCHEDYKCWAFEYCFDDKLYPAQSCYFIRLSEEKDESLKLIKDLEQNLTSSNNCSIYRLSSVKLNLRVTLHSSHMESMVRWTNFLKLCCIGPLFVVLGALIQVGYMAFKSRHLN